MSFLNILRNIFKPKMFYAICYKEKNDSFSEGYTVHAFTDEQSRNDWIININQINRIHTNDLLPIASAVPANDTHVKEAKKDVKLNPVVYNNVDYINNRIYIEHGDERLRW